MRMFVVSDEKPGCGLCGEHLRADSCVTVHVRAGGQVFNTNSDEQQCPPVVIWNSLP